MYFCQPAYAIRLIAQRSYLLMQNAFVVYAPQPDRFKAR